MRNRQEEKTDGQTDRQTARSAPRSLPLLRVQAPASERAGQDCVYTRTCAQAKTRGCSNKPYVRARMCELPYACVCRTREHTWLFKQTDHVFARSRTCVCVLSDLTYMSMRRFRTAPHVA